VVAEVVMVVQEKPELLVKVMPVVMGQQLVHMIMLAVVAVEPEELVTMV
tara:strand:+ start:151 stop:297 length:147 start_codon:yes stop_codon:yes gene_type:complete